MSYRDIVIDACPKNNIEQTLKLARAFAVAFDAKLLVAAYAWPKARFTDALSGNSLSVQIKAQEMQESLDSSRTAFKKVFPDASIDVEWCEGIRDPASALQEHLLAADLLITSVSEDNGCVMAEPAELALNSGTPVLRTGGAITTCHFSNVLVAWKDCPQARRALHDALPILERADKVTVVGVGDEINGPRLESVAAHLSRHNVSAGHLHLSRSEYGVGADLICHAHRETADLIVAGAYSRGPIAERVWGGVTRELLRTGGLSWFMAH